MGNGFAPRAISDASTLSANPRARVGLVRHERNRAVRRRHDLWFEELCRSGGGLQQGRAPDDRS